MRAFRSHHRRGRKPYRSTETRRVCVTETVLAGLSARKWLQLLMQRREQTGWNRWVHWQ